MPRKPTLAVYANPWHAPLDHNHRANAACPWDPEDHNPDRGFVGAQLRLDEDGDHYFEFDQYEPTVATAKTIIVAGREAADAKLARAGEEAAAQEAHADQIAHITAARAAHADALAKMNDGVPEFDDLVLRDGHEPVTLPDTLYYRKAIRRGEIWAGDLATYKAVFERETGYRKITEMAATMAKHSAEGHAYRHLGEKPDPKPRPAVGMGRVGQVHAARPLSSVNPIHAADLRKAAQAGLARGIAESQKAALAAAKTAPTDSNDHGSR